MSLYTDDDLLTQAMLGAVDPEVTDIANVESITVAGDASIIRQAWDECADSLLEKMDAFGGSLSLVSGTGTASYGTGLLGLSRPRVFLTQIIATDPLARRVSVLQRAMLYRALVLFFRAASRRAGTDRYEERLKQYRKDEKRHWRNLWVRGLPIVLQPLPCPGSLHEFNAGSWTAANLSGVAGGATAQTTYDVAITWVDGSKYVSAASKGNAESGPSSKLTFVLPLNQLLRVDITSLNPPDGSPLQARGTADGVLSTLKATGWNLYVGAQGGTLYLQNAAPIPVATKQHTLAAAPALSGSVLEPGQYADANMTFENVLQRA